MLGSITPLGERSRQQRWGVTVGAYVLGSALGGAALGALAGAIGAFVLVGVPGGGTLAVLGLAASLGALLDSGLLGWRLPTVRRQVDDGWMHGFRGWVYGLGFGLQLGAGVVTVVTTAAVYLVFLAGLLTASPAAGALVGLVFGVARALPLLGAARVATPGALGRVERRLRRLEPGARRLAIAGQAGVALGVVAAIAG